MIIILKNYFENAIPFILVGGILIGVIVYNLFYSREAIVKRKIRKTGGKRISDFQTGDVAKVVGTVKYIGETLIAPMSGRKCSYYYMLVEERVSNGKSSSWHTIIEEGVAGNIILKDGNSYALIETLTVKSHIIEDRQYRSGFLEDASEKMNAYLSKHGRKSVGWIGLNKTIRYKEGVLEEGELVAVVGKGSWKRKSELQLEIPSERILLISPNEEEPVYFSDDPKVAVVDKTYI